MEWTAERNPDREYNFRIRELGAGRFAVVSDSERFGADQVVFESFRRGECVDYVTQRRDPGKWNYYVIEDLSSWIRGSKNPSPLERVFPQNHGNLMKPTDIPLRLWRNPYFHSERLRIADRLKAKHKRDTMTATKRKDIQER